MRSGTLPVPGATLYYEVSGAGPVLLLLPGSGGDAAVFDPILDPLAQHFTVVTIDPRGYSRSVLDPGPPADIEVEVQSEDAHSLLRHLTPAGEDAYVFGGSGGAVVALDLLARHPDRLRLVIAHEPPSFAVLPDAAEHKAFVDEVYELFVTEGLAAAGARFLEGIGGGVRMPDPAGLSPRAAAMIERLHANAPRNMAHELRTITSHLPDVAALAAVADRLVLGAGRETKGKLPHRPAEELARRIGIPLIEFPGGHSGFTDAPAEFAQLLLELLLAARVE
ncbi:alpha/beta hydrolase [Nocardia implantans]|uniref:Alpha/beta hydrolase n=1 Tax=Nocardia implantans TaxID=3108168 RepID=A0ABU6AXT0_9NOCA|nr:MULTISPECIES: alpha/beta hydrolase [unclassified Nocardia]MBF6193757.1 alpha/beta hydrolase [Nocardia beijingensis]MEA3529507.1 alpha/beta hydrolase [Nocardia sp. CDC192]MEB3512093.1 alpha/beta hydrolase [Nocardia sp. CDC186]